MGVFLFFGATMAAFAGITLTLPGTPLDRIWILNPRAYQQMAPLGRSAGVLFLLVCAAMTIAGAGWFQRKRWGWLLAVIIIATQVAGDMMNFFRGEHLAGGFGVVIAGALLMYLLSRKVRAVFAGGGLHSGTK
jgi:hypothetical protein